MMEEKTDLRNQYKAINKEKQSNAKHWQCKNKFTFFLNMLSTILSLCLLKENITFCFWINKCALDIPFEYATELNKDEESLETARENKY